MITEQEEDKQIDVVAVWLIDNIDPDCLGLQKLSDPIGKETYFSARTVAKLLSGKAGVPSGRLIDIVRGLEGLQKHQE